MGKKRTTTLQASCGPLGAIDPQTPRAESTLSSERDKPCSPSTLFFLTQFPHQPTLTLLLTLGPSPLRDTQQSFEAAA